MILLITIDCLRADHVSSYGYSHETTPTLDQLSAAGVSWEQAFSTSSWTKPSVTSLFSGLYPSQHGAFLGIKRSKNRPTVTTDVLHCTTPTLAECLSRSGWRCGAFINNAQLGPFTRLDRGFQEYQPTVGKADRLLDAFEKWCASDLETPTFAYLHFLEAHWPYKPRRRHVAMFGGDRDANAFRDYRARDYARLRRSISKGECKLPEEKLTQMIQMYDGAIRRLDGKIKRLLGLLKKWRVYDQTAVFITADHGEELLDHGRIGHGQSLHRELTHVPLIAVGPGLPSGVRCAEPVSHVDLPRTLATLAGAGDDLPGSDLLQSDTQKSPPFSELRIRRRYTQAWRTRDWSYIRRYSFDPDGDELLSTQSPREWIADNPYDIHESLFDRSVDRLEQNDLAADAAHRDDLRRIVSRLDDWWSTLKLGQEGDASTDDVELDPRVVQHLRDLGYLE